MRNTVLFPFPHFVDGEMREGSMLAWPTTCVRCNSRECLHAKDDTISTCSYGFNYERVEHDVIVAGVLVRDMPTTTSSHKKLLHEGNRNLITKHNFEASVNALRQAGATLNESIANEKRRALDEYIAGQQHKVDFLNLIKPEIQKGLSFVHDYKQINAQISQNINVIIESRYSGATLEEKLNQASQQEKAIYEASKFLDEKLSVAKFLLHPEWLDNASECVRFRFHGIVFKYLQIYRPRFEKKGIHPNLSGKSFSELVANPEASSVIPHTLIDNAAKYSPLNGKVTIITQDEKDGVEFSVSSYGPRIRADEIQRIFQPFFRGDAAKEMEEDGAGYGLYACQLIASHHFGTKVSVTQESQPRGNLGYWTTFAVRLPLRAKMLS